MAPFGATTRTPTSEKLKLSMLKHNVEKELFNQYVYLFEVTKMSIHGPTDCFQKFKSLLCFNSWQGSNLDKRLLQFICENMSWHGNSNHLSTSDQINLLTRLNRACSNVDLALWSSWNISKRLKVKRITYIRMNLSWTYM